MSHPVVYEFICENSPIVSGAHPKCEVTLTAQKAFQVVIATPHTNIYAIPRETLSPQVNALSNNLRLDG